MKSLACYKEIVDRNMEINGDSFEDSEKSRAREKAFFLEYMSIIMNRNLVGIQMLKVILMRSQMEVRDTLLETREKAILVIK